MSDHNPTGSEYALAALLAIAVAVVMGVAIIFSPYSMEQVVNQCSDNVVPSYTATGEVYGDANGDGILSGSECEWR